MEKNFKEMFLEELNEIFNAENQLVKALPAVIEAAESAELKEAIRQHLDETKNQVSRLNKIFKLLNINPTNVNSEAMQVLIKDCNTIVNKLPLSFVRDAALIAKAQKIEHFEIATYGALRTFAKLLELNDVEDLLEDNESEEGNADKILTKIAEGGWFTAGINQKASVEQ